jgi:hypothetical protein
VNITESTGIRIVGCWWVVTRPPLREFTLPLFHTEAPTTVLLFRFILQRTLYAQLTGQVQERCLCKDSLGKHEKENSQVIKPAGPLNYIHDITCAIIYTNKCSNKPFFSADLCQNEKQPILVVALGYAVIVHTVAYIYMHNFRIFKSNAMKKGKSLVFCLKSKPESSCPLHYRLS